MKFRVFDHTQRRTMCCQVAVHGRDLRPRLPHGGARRADRRPQLRQLALQMLGRSRVCCRVAIVCPLLLLLLLLQ